MRTQLYIDGQWVDGIGKLPVYDPSDGSVIAEVSLAGDAQCDAAVTAADAAAKAWAKTAPRYRSEILRKAFELMTAENELIATLISRENGKAMPDARGEATYAAEFFRWFAEETVRTPGDFRKSPSGDKRILVSHEPIGVSILITPWNFPIAMITRKIAPALAAGCTIVIKPAEQTPLSALALAELSRQAGIPPGVVNVVTGDADHSVLIGKALCSSPIVRHLSFTGSTEVGRILMAQCAPTIKKLGLELGGHAPFIVFEDADIDAAVAGAMASKYRNAGQTCVCANRFYVHSKVIDTFTERFAKAVQTLTIGNGLDAGVMQGPLIDKAALTKVEEHVADALAKGAKLVTGGKVAAIGGHFYEPTILSHITTTMRISSEETFGPVAPIMAFDDDAEVVRLANQSPFGLASYFYSRDIGRIWNVAEALEYGIVGVNSGAVSNEVGPFGGVKQSGLGREGSVWGMDEYLEMKYVCVGL